MFSLNEFMQAFDNNLLFAWEVLHAEIQLQSAPVSADQLRRLVLLYSKGLERCAHLVDSQENYFKLKIDQLMGQRKVIQCLQDEQQKKRKDHPQDQNGRNEHGREQDPKGNRQQQSARTKIAASKIYPSLQARKREIEMRLAYDIQQSRTNKVSKMLKEESLRQEKLQGMVLKCINSEQQKLKQKIQQRKQRASISGRISASFKLSNSVVSTCSYGMDSCDNLDTILDQIPFVTGNPDL